MKMTLKRRMKINKTILNPITMPLPLALMVSVESFKQIATDGYGKRCKPQALRLLERFQITPQLCITTRCTCMEDAKIAVTVTRTCTGST